MPSVVVLSSVYFERLCDVEDSFIMRLIFEQQFSEILKTYEGLLQKNDSELTRLLHDCKTLAKTIKTQSFVHQPVPPDIRDYIPPKEVSDQLVHAYFQTSELVFRVLHIPTFHKDYNRYWENPGTSS